MSLAAFREEPWKKSHQAYQASIFTMTPAPEYASSEVLLSSLYRVAGFSDITEKSVASRGKVVDRFVQKHRDRGTSPDGSALDGDSFYTMLHSVLESPKLPNQSSKRFLQVTPLVPQSSMFSGSPRLGGNPWNAGSLVRRMISLGSKDDAEAQSVWHALFDALSVGDDDDIFARFLQDEVRAWDPGPTWSVTPFEVSSFLAPGDREGLQYPARRFVSDLYRIMDAKQSMTRRQWTSLLESIIRLAAVSHVIWICDVQSRIWGSVKESLSGSGPSNEVEARAAVLPDSLSYLSYGDRALPGLTDRVAGFLKSRLGLNAVLWAAEDCNEGIMPSLSSCSEIADFCRVVRNSRDRMNAAGLAEVLGHVNETENWALLCKKGIGSNLMEFSRHMLGQRQAANPILRGYDQGYILRKKGSSQSSPWIVGLGPVAVLALVHCSLAETSGPRSVRRLAEHMAAYGISVEHQDIAKNDLGQQLRMLGLVLDSPDAESGMLLVPPFERQQV
ncbi:hypothetical protein ACCS45_03890 [Rhizobium ruizarguesonis]